MRPFVSGFVGLLFALMAGCSERGPVLTLRDGGVDAGGDQAEAGVADAAADAGHDAGSDAAADAGTDGGPPPDECVPVTPSPADPLDGSWDRRFHLPGVGGTAPTDVNALAVAPDGALYAGGHFSHGGPVPARNVVRYTDAEGFTALDAGLANDVFALAVDPRDGAVYAATQDGAGGAEIHRFDGAVWALVASAEGGLIEELRVAADGTLYAAGSFSTIGGESAPYFARYDGASWSSVGGAPDSEVRTILLDASGPCIGGRFANIGSTPAQNVACWDGSSWTAYSLPVDFYAVEALTRDGTGALVAGGHFDLDPGDGVDAGSIARWNGAAWEHLGGGVVGPAGPGYVEGLAWIGGQLYVAGYFRMAGAVAAESIARWDGSAWHDVGGASREVGFFLETRNVTQLAAAPGERVYAGGMFTRVGALSASHVAYLDAAGWHTLVEPGQAPAGVNGFVDALAARGDCGVYAGGEFDLAGAVSAHNVVRVDAAGAHPLGAGVDGVVRALDVAADGTVYAGGDLALGNVASFDGANWAAVGEGVDGPVYALLVASDGTLYAGGSFTSAGTTPASNIAAWDGAAWRALEGGVDGQVNALIELPDGRVVAGGELASAGGVRASGVAAWDGSAWAPLGEGLPEAGVRSLAIYEGALVAGGTFGSLGDAAGKGIARWDGTRWSTIGGGLFRRYDWAPVYVNGLAAAGGVLFAAGDIALFEGGEDVRLVVYDGATWQPMGSGLTDIAEAAIVTQAGVWIGGTFTAAGGVAAVGLAHWAFD